MSPLEEPFNRLHDKRLKPEKINPFDPQLGDSHDYQKIDADQIITIENGILANGFECLAFYKSVRYKLVPPIRGFWGIFIFDYAVSYLAGEIQRYYEGQSVAENEWNAALAFLYFHERFHFRFDAWALSQESTTGKPLYENYRNHIYRAFHPQEFVFEETLANIHALTCIRSYGIQSFCREFVESQPGAYSNIKYATRKKLLGVLAAQLVETNVLGSELPEHAGYIAHHRSASTLDKECPVYLLRGLSPQMFVVSNISLPNISEIENGFLRKYLAGELTRSDHKYFKIDNGEKIKCPNPHSKDIRLYEFKNIVGKAGLRTSEYFEQRRHTNVWQKEIPRSYPKRSLF